MSVGQAVAAVGVPATADPDARDPTLLLGGDFGGVRVAAVDPAGRVAAWAGDAGRTLALGVCPGEDTLVEVAATDGHVTLHRWALPDLAPRGDAVPLGAERSWDAAVRCLDERGSRAVVVLPAYGEDGTIAVVDGAEAERHAAPVQAAAVGGPTMSVLLGSGGPGEGAASTIGVLDDSGGSTELLRQPTVIFDRLDVSPDGGHIVAAGYPVQGGGDVLVSVAADGSEHTERRTDAYHRLGWFTDDRIWLRVEDGPFGATTTTVDLLDTDLHGAGSLDVGATAEVQQLPDGALLRHGLAPPSALREGGVTPVGALRLTDTRGDPAGSGRGPVRGTCPGPHRHPDLHAHDRQRGRPRGRRRPRSRRGPALAGRGRGRPVTRGMVGPRPGSARTLGSGSSALATPAASPPCQAVAAELSFTQRVEAPHQRTHPAGPEVALATAGARTAPA